MAKCHLKLQLLDQLVENPNSIELEHVHSTIVLNRTRNLYLIINSKTKVVRMTTVLSNSLIKPHRSNQTEESLLRRRRTLKRLTEFVQRIVTLSNSLQIIRVNYTKMMKLYHNKFKRREFWILSNSSIQNYFKLYKLVTKAQLVNRVPKINQGYKVVSWVTRCKGTCQPRSASN